MEPFLQKLAAVFPPDRLYTDDVRLAAYESDGLTAFRAKPRAVVVPVDEAEVIAAVRICREHNLPFVARGSGTSLSGGALPVEEGIVIALNRLNRILRVDPVDQIAVVEPAVINAHVSAAARAHGLYYAPDPSSQTVCTIGGNVAFNSGGAHCLKYGMTANHLLGARVLLPSGEIVELGGSSMQGIGPDLVGFFAGHEGLFGIGLEFTLRLMPLPETCQTILAAYDSLEAAGNAVSAVVSSGVLPAAMEIMDRLAIDAAEAAVDAGYPRDAAAVLIVEVDGEREAVDAEFAAIVEKLSETGAVETRIARDAADRMRIWRGRKSAFSAVGRLSPDFLVQDGVVPRGRLGEALEKIGRMSRRSGLRVANVFHAGDGNLHPLILFDGAEDGALERAEGLAEEILALCIEMEGSVTGEHGIGMEKRAFMARMFSADDLALFGEIRRSIDPGEIANRGKVLPAGEAPSLQQVGLHPLEKAGVIERE